MRNLALESDVQQLVQLTAEDEHVVRACLDAAVPGRLYIATSYCDLLCVSAPGSKGAQVLWRQPIGAVAGGPDSTVTALSYSLELEGLCIGLSTGELLFLNTESCQLEEVGSIEGGIVALQWSPDGEVFAAVSGVGQLLLMNQEWELLGELTIGSVPEGAGGPDAAAWFSDVQLTWRGDGKFFATSHKVLKEGTLQRCIQIWDREKCELHSTAEAADGQLPVLAWQPNGRHLYAAQRAGAVPANVPVSTMPALTAGLGPEGQEGAAPRPSLGPGVRASARAAAAGAAVPISSGGLAPGKAPGQATPRVLLYERNGLGHGGFDLRSAGDVHSLAWSSDSNLLGTLQQAPAGAGWLVQVWHRSNWHWYLKYERQYSGGPAGSPPPQLLWDDQVPSRLHVVVTSAPGGSGGSVGAAHHSTLTFLWDICASDCGTTVVVDGGQLLMTTLRHAVVPPPMSSVRASLPGPAACVAVSSSGVSQDERVAALLSDGRVAVLRCVEDDLWEETLQEHQQSAQEAGGPPPTTLTPLLPTLQGGPLPGGHVRALTWLDDSTLIAVAGPQPQLPPQGGSPAPQGDVLVELAVQWPQGCPEDDGLVAADSSQGCSLHVSSVTPAGGTVLRVVAAQLPHLQGSAVVELDDGQVRVYTPAGSGAGSQGAGRNQGRLTSSPASHNFPTGCSLVVATPALTTATAGGQAPALGLSSTGALYWGSTQVATEVTSFTARAGGPGGPALLYCTRRNLLYTVFFTQLVAGYTHQELTEEAAAISGKQVRAEIIERDSLRAAMHAAMRPSMASAAARDTVVRAVEQGASLVAAPKAGVDVVLQMPRGNLEGVSPRALVLAAIAHALVHLDYKTAWTLATTHRADLNLLVDWQWPAFLSHAPEFVAAVPLASDLCDLLAALRPDNVCSEGGLYSNIAVDPKQQPAKHSSPSPPQLFHDHDGDSDKEKDDTPDRPEAAGSSSLVNGHSAAGQQQHDGSSSGSDATSGRLSDQEVQKLVSAGSKVNAVCSAVRAAVLARMATQSATSSGAGGQQGSAGGVDGEAGADGVARALPGSAAAAASRELLSVVVSSYACSDPPQLSAALAAIRDAKEQALADASTTGSGTTTDGPAERALRALLLHVDPDVAYREALGLYELPLAFMVITHAQRDPGEYLLELQRFGAISDPNLRRHAIDVHLGRYEPALRHLVAAGPASYEQALTLARTHGLLRQLLTLLDAQVQQAHPAPGATRAAAASAPAAPPEHQEFRRKVLMALGSVLEEGRKYEDAGLTYVAAGAVEDAMRAYRSGCHWRQTFTLAGRLQYDGPALSRLASEVAEELRVGVQHQAEAEVLLLYLKDTDNGVLALTRAKDWREAVRVCYQYARPDLIPTVVAPAAAASAAGLLSEAKEACERISKYLSRLSEVRAKREALDAALKAAQEEGGGVGPSREELADAASDVAASILTGLSVYTEHTYAGTGTVAGSTKAPSTLGGRRAHKMQERRDRKARKGRVRQGSPEEEISLVGHVLGLSPTEAQLSEAGSLSELLVMLGHEGDARTLQGALSAWQAAYQGAVADIAAHPVPAERVPPSMQDILQKQQNAISSGPPAVAWKWDFLRTG